MYDTVCAELGVPFRRTGQILCLRQKWARYLVPDPALLAQHGVPCEYLSRAQVLEREPGLSGEMQCGLSFPGGHCVPYGLTIAYAENAVDNGAELFLDTAVTGMELKEGEIRLLRTNQGSFFGRVVVNAAGVFSDEVAGMAGDRFLPSIPQGTNSILDKKGGGAGKDHRFDAGHGGHKKAHTKGGGIVSTVDGNLLIGPDAVETPDREDYATSRASVGPPSAAGPGVLPTGDIITYLPGCAPL